MYCSTKSPSIFNEKECSVLFAPSVVEPDEPCLLAGSLYRDEDHSYDCRGEDRVMITRTIELTQTISQNKGQ